MIKSALNKLVQNQHLTRSETSHIISLMMKGEVSPIQIAAILTAFRTKGETLEEITGCIDALRANMTQFPEEATAFDIGGTGGDGTGTFNISTTTAFVVAGCAVKVIKHGNRKASSLCGSADVLEALGVKIQLSPADAHKVFQTVGMVFLFAPIYHASMKHVAPVRKELGVRTLFNFPGPFSNPAKVTYQLVGTPSKEIATKLAQVIKELGYKKLLLFFNEEGMDEIGLASPTHFFEVQGKTIRTFSIDPQMYGFSKASTADLRGGDATVNANITIDILNGKKGVQRDVVLLNSAVALLAAQKVKTVEEGISLATHSIDSGKALSILEQLKQHSNTYETYFG